ncbi:zinc finger protein 43-like [Athalia rosae]|uniref:zinc finger protein 43-like n=1 Tax=Athalia rosae TaxID=37344 RepID=UPI00203484E7|nr:zinc finger protein 43-like [Athalia rosae]
MKTFTLKVGDTTNVTMTADETFKDLKEKLQMNNIDFDVMTLQIKGKPITDNLAVANYINFDHNRPDDEAVEFVLPDLPDVAPIHNKVPSTKELCNGLLCRLCGIKTEDPIRIFGKFQDISKKINSLIPLSISRNDQLSKHICTTCLQKLDIINEFIAICKETEEKFHSILRLKESPIGAETGIQHSEGDEKNLLIDDRTTIYQCPNCKIDLKITRIIESQNCQSTSKILSNVSKPTLKRVAQRSHNLRSSNANRRICTRFGKTSKKFSKTAAQEKPSGLERVAKEIENTSTPLELNSESTLSSSIGEILSVNNANCREKGKMKLRDIRKRMSTGEPATEKIVDPGNVRISDSDALEDALFSINSEPEVSGITGEFVEFNTLEENSNESIKKRSRFKCESCAGEYFSQKRYLFHLERHDSENFYDFECTICKKKFSTEDVLWEHRQYHFTDSPEGADGSHDNVVGSQSEANRKSTKSTCEECGARFVLRERYEFHMERHKSGNIKVFFCMICSKRFKSENILWDHYQYQHKSGERFACMTCHKTFVKRANLSYHLKTFGHKGGKIVAIPDQIQKTDIETGIKLSDVSKPRPKITCVECGARFVLQERYEFHLERHKTGKMDICVCSLCGRESTNENVLWDHYQYMHKRTKRYACTTCGKLFHKQSMLSRHQMKYGHKGKKEIDVDTDGNTVSVDSAAFKKVIAEEVVEMKSVNCVLCGELVRGVDPNLINDAVTCANCEGPGLSLQVDSDGAKVISRRQYHCNMCNKHFTTKDRLEYHIMRHSENMDEFICSTCGKELSTEQALFEHYLFVHKGARPHVCELCGKSYQFKARLKEHMRSHSGERPFACEICGQRCMTNNALRSHKKTHITEKRFPCQICKKAFRKRQDLNEHLERHWKNDKTMMFPQVFSCAVCLEMFPTFRILKKHMKETHRVENQDPILQDLQPWFECEDCHEKFKHQMSLKVHRERAHEGKMRPVYHCDVCNVTYKNARVLSNHIKNKHQGGKRYKCAQCGKEYNQSTSLHNHILLHTGEKPFSCEHCEMTFRTKESRDHHQRKHTGERPYKCPRCDKTFATTTQRREHRKREHDEGNTHSCPECGKVCFDEHGVRSHLNTHFSDRFKNIQEN